MMMLTFEFSVNILILAGITLASGAVGLWIRGRQLSNYRTRISQLENEMLESSAEILELQKDYINMESKLRDFQIPVIPIKTIVKELSEEKSEKFADISLRKKLLGKENSLHQSIAIK